MRENCPYLEFSGPYFPVFGLNTDSISLYSAPMWENAEQKNFEYENFLRSAIHWIVHKN